MTKIQSFLLVGLTLILTTSCNKGGEDAEPIQEEISTPVSTYSSTILNEYAGLQLELIKATPGYEAPVAARTMAYLALAAYESAVPGISGKQSLAGQLEGFDNIPEIEKNQEYNWPIAVNASQHTLMKNLYGTTSDVNKTKMDDLKKKYEDALKVGVGTDAIERSIRFGAEMANAVWNYSKTDGGHLAYDNNYPLSNSLFNSVSSWKPTGDKNRPLLPKWGEVRSFVKANSSSIAPAAEPFSFDENSTFFAEAYDTYLTVNSLSTGQEEIMNFWEMPHLSATQAGNQLALVANLINKENYKLDKALELYLKTTFAMHDALVNSWKSKFTNNLMRPETYINQAIDPNWSPNQDALPAPDYTSEESSLVAAVATILANEFGEVYTFEVTSQYDKSKKRAYKNFTNYVKEAEVAPIYAGIHYRMSAENGSKQGQKIGNNILNINLNNIPVTDSTAVRMAF
ncbi:phosphoesterase [Arcticibacterium luteifluviistationis]|uniref:Phosphoesterase n=1 Tax=Arcticibacterium luteifluviistationis TaxID=1784714 RepID=A0A2Z4GA53_9BACT|nr:phosphoesterase [Arcticibacterium luteifluviistationis]AWV98122.1 phosphoesterase [Arcticibacterium luteifluviistationis]